MAERGRLAHVFAHLSARPQNVPGNEWVLAANSIMPPEIDGNHLRLGLQRFQGPRAHQLLECFHAILRRVTAAWLARANRKCCWRKGQRWRPEIERSTIAVFEKVSPSVVQVVGRQSNALSNEEAEGGGVQSGTGFIWDEAGDSVRFRRKCAHQPHSAPRKSEFS
jgi:hypothetical protein